ncbi:MAG: ACT domain-containing protein [Eubacterium sp.]
MYIHQISVFIVNKPGNLADLTSFLAENNIDLRAVEVADSSDYGIIRLIVNDPFNTLTLLKDHDWICKITPVIGVKIPDTPGAMAKVMGTLATEDISVDYVYAFLSREAEDALMIFRVQDNDKVASLLKKNGIRIVDQEDLENM